jgi:hypothetical protein
MSPPLTFCTTSLNSRQNRGPAATTALRRHVYCFWRVLFLARKRRDHADKTLAPCDRGALARKGRIVIPARTVKGSPDCHVARAQAKHHIAGDVALWWWRSLPGSETG